MDLTKYSTFQRLVRVTAWILRYASNCKLSKEKREMSTTLSPVDIIMCNWSFALCELVTLRCEASHPPKDHPVIKLIITFKHSKLSHGTGTSQRIYEEFSER